MPGSNFRFSTLQNWNRQWLNLEPHLLSKKLIGTHAAAARKPGTKFRKHQALPAILPSVELLVRSISPRWRSMGIAWSIIFSSGSMNRPLYRSQILAPTVMHGDTPSMQTTRSMDCDLMAVLLLTGPFFMSTPKDEAKMSSIPTGIYTCECIRWDEYDNEIWFWYKIIQYNIYIIIILYII